MGKCCCKAKVKIKGVSVQEQAINKRDYQEEDIYNLYKYVGELRHILQMKINAYDAQYMNCDEKINKTGKLSRIVNLEQWVYD